MNFLLPFKMAWDNMRAAKGRTFLTILGVVIGIAAVTIVMSVGASAQQLILGQLSGLGSNLIGIIPGEETESGMPATAMGIVIKTLTNDDIAALRKKQNVPHLVAVAGYVTGNASVSSDRYSGMMTFNGVSPDIVDIEDIVVEEGRFFTSLENARRARVVVLGAERAREFFGNASPIGQKVSIKSQTFTVIGVLEERGAVGFTNQDANIYIPLVTAQKVILGIDHLNFARAKVTDEKYNAQTIDDVVALLRTRHDIDNGDPADFAIKDTASALTMITDVTNILTYFLATVAAVALVVGGIGVMNVMFIVLSQRMREIGLRKALGATRGDIAGQFLAEAIIVSLVGGIVGIAVGLIVTVLIAVGINALGYEYALIFSWDAIGLALVISIAIGAIFGAYPAIKASRVSPMESLRYE